MAASRSLRRICDQEAVQFVYGVKIVSDDTPAQNT